MIALVRGVIAASIARRIDRVISRIDIDQNRRRAAR